MRIDISGNWIWLDAPARGLIVSQPLPPRDGNRFAQELTLPAGSCKLHVVYKANLDHAPGKAVFYSYSRHPIIVNGTTIDLTLCRVGDSEEYRGVIRFDHPGGTLHLETRVQDTHCFNSTVLEVCGDGEVFTPSDLYALPGCGEQELTIVRGVPFLSSHYATPINMWGYAQFFDVNNLPVPYGQLTDWAASGISCGDAPVDTLYCLGMTHSYDISNGSWYFPTGDYGFHHFVGDRVGMLELTYSDGEAENIPLIYGFNVWYGMPWDLPWDQQNNWGCPEDIRTDDAEFFAGNVLDRQTVQGCVGLDDGIRRMGEETNERYIFTLKLGGRKLHSLRVLPEEGKYGIVTLSAVTLRTADKPASPNALRPLPVIASCEGRLTVHTLEDVRRETYLPAINRLQHVFYTFVDELPVLNQPIIPEGYLGPRYDFTGAQDAFLAATYLYRNGPDCASFISDNGMDCSSPTAHWHTACYVNGIGLSQPTKPYYDGTEDFLRKYAQRAAGEFPGCGGAWTRGVGELLRETMALGYDKCVRNYLDWLDHALFHYANPPHWKRSLLPQAGDHSERMVGDTLETGNRENDGHGICMWGRYMMWLWMDRDAAWNEAHWEATKAACEWLQWQLDTDMILPGVRKDVLYTESECVHGGYDVYSSGNCLHGLRLSILMAQQLGKTEEVARWTALYERLAQGMLDHLQVDSDFGPLWYTDAGCDWQDHAHKMVHLQLAPDGITYTPAEDYTDGFDAAFLAIDRNCYRWLMSHGTYDFLRMYGYGQGMATQAALLLDEMYDAGQLVHMLVTHCYLPRMEGFLAPEGIVTHPGGKFYVPVNGYMGQDSHIADSVKAIRLLLGVDDNREGLLRLVPRFPASWEHCGIEDYPVLTPSGRGRIAYTIERSEQQFKMDITVSAPVALDLRVGPFASCPADTACVNGETVAVKPFKSGDSWWVWVRGMEGSRFTVEIG